MGPENESSDRREISTPDGGTLVWNGETGEVTIAVNVTDPDGADDSMHDVSDTDLDV